MLGSPPDGPGLCCVCPEHSQEEHEERMAACLSVLPVSSVVPARAVSVCDLVLNGVEARCLKTCIQRTLLSQYFECLSQSLSCDVFLNSF